MFYNGTKLTQVVYDFGEPREIFPRFFFFVSKFSFVPKIFPRFIEPIKSELVEAANTIVIKRLGALGDVLMSIPVARQIRELYPEKKIVLVVGASYYKSQFIHRFNCGAYDKIVPDVGFSGLAPDEIGFDFTSVMELDHYFSEWKSVHRVDIYRSLIGLNTRVEPVWIPQPIFSEEKKWVVFSSGGSWAVKTLKREIADWIFDEIKKREEFVIHNRDDYGVRLEADDMISCLVSAKCLITTDSAPLWMSHFTNTPVVLLHSASRPSERLSYHPLRPEGVAGIDLAAMVGCEPCFESLQKCEGRVDCFNVIDKEVLLKEILEKKDRVEWKI